MVAMSVRLDVIASEVQDGAMAPWARSFAKHTRQVKHCGSFVDPSFGPKEAEA